MPNQYLSTSPVRDDATNNRLTQQVPNPFAGLLPGTGLNGANVARSQLLRPYPQFTSIQATETNGESQYHALQGASSAGWRTDSPYRSPTAGHAR